MSDKIDNLTLEQNHDMLGEVADMREAMMEELASVRGDMFDLDQKVDGVALCVTMRAGHVHHIDGRLERVEGKIGIVE